MRPSRTPSPRSATPRVPRWRPWSTSAGSRWTRAGRLLGVAPLSTASARATWSRPARPPGDRLVEARRRGRGALAAYNLVAPVVDGRRGLGAVTVDDLLDHLLRRLGATSPWAAVPPRRRSAMAERRSGRLDTPKEQRGPTVRAPVVRHRCPFGAVHRAVRPFPSREVVDVDDGLRRVLGNYRTR